MFDIIVSVLLQCMHCVCDLFFCRSSFFVGDHNGQMYVMNALTEEGNIQEVRIGEEGGRKEGREGRRERGKEGGGKGGIEIESTKFCRLQFL